MEKIEENNVENDILNETVIHEEINVEAVKGKKKRRKKN